MTIENYIDFFSLTNQKLYEFLISKSNIEPKSDIDLGSMNLIENTDRLN